jgi:hypothetical protein
VHGLLLMLLMVLVLLLVVLLSMVPLLVSGRCVST